MTRYAMVIDLNKCIGCQACVAACTIQNQTPFWAGKYRTHVIDMEFGEFPYSGRKFTPRLCMHCENAPCVAVCPTGATHVEEGGIVAIDQYKCIRCGYCAIACPYGAHYIYEESDVMKAKELYGEPLVHLVPHMDKCNFCVDTRLPLGLEPACVDVCPTEARIFGDLDDPNSKVAKLVNEGRALPHRPELGTKPKVFYIGTPSGIPAPKQVTRLPVEVWKKELLAPLELLGVGVIAAAALANMVKSVRAEKRGEHEIPVRYVEGGEKE